MITEIKTNSAKYLFDSLSELGQFIADAPRKWNTSQSKDIAARQDWDLSAGFEGAVKMAREGWLEGAARAQDALKAFSPVTPAPETITDFYGHRPHVARFCAGAPDSMIRHARPPREGFGKVLTLIVPVNANGMISAQCMANFGLGVAQYVSQLELDRVRVEVIGLTTTLLRGGYRESFAWRIKGADQPLDLAVLAFAIGHPAMCRRLDFALCERAAGPETSGYGQSVDGKLEDVINCPVNAYVLNGMNSADKYAETPEQALEHISAEIDKALGAKEY